MLVKEVLLKYQKLVPFPWTLPKISKAGYVPKDFLIDIGNELSQCDDAQSPTARKVIESTRSLQTESS